MKVSRYLNKTQQSWNSTLKMGSCELKRRPLKPISDKRKDEIAIYNALKDILIGDCYYNGDYPVSELSGNISISGLSPHHIDGRRGLRLIDPFNIIVIDEETEHKQETKHHTFERIQELLVFIKPIRLAQGFIEGEILTLERVKEISKSRERQELKAIVRPIRIKQGFKPCNYE